MVINHYRYTLSCYLYHCVKLIPYGQVLRRGQICSSNTFLDNRSNQLEKWLYDGNYKQKLVREQDLKVGTVSEEILLNDESNLLVEDHMVPNLTCYL